jgi:hypothetical protein
VNKTDFSGSKCLRNKKYIAYRNKTCTTGRRTPDMFATCKGSDVTPTMAARSTTVEMTVKM